MRLRPADLALAGLGLLAPCATPGSRPVTPATAAAAADVAADPTESAAVEPADPRFATAVRPILLQRCAPCHEPGGKMYDRLPFDRADVVAAHPEGVLKRLKGEERETLLGWFAERQPAGGVPEPAPASEPLTGPAGAPR